MKNQNNKFDFPLYPKEVYSQQYQSDNGEFSHEQTQNESQNNAQNNQSFLQNPLFAMLLSSMQKGDGKIDAGNLMSIFANSNSGQQNNSFDQNQMQLLQNLTQSMSKNKKQNSKKESPACEKLFPKDEIIY